MLSISLFGRFSARHHDRPFTGWESQKVQELVAYLLLHPGRPHRRELLADVLWGEVCTTARSKSYLRKTLWKLQSALQADFGAEPPPFLRVDAEWVQLDLAPPLDLDVARFDEAARLLGRDAQPLPAERLDALGAAVALYRADLLEGWAYDWCFLERERLRHLLLVVLDALMDGCEARGDTEAAIAHGHRALRYDRAREYTHRHLMRLYLRRRDRTAALRQFQQCERALDEELGVRPSWRTLALYDDVCRDAPSPPPCASPEAEPDVRQNLLGIEQELAALQRHLRQTIRTLDDAPASPSA